MAIFVRSENLSKINCQKFSFHTPTIKPYMVLLQEKVERLDMGTIPRSMTVVLEYDLVDSCKAGDDVTIYGIVTQMWDQPVVDTRCSLETVLNANSIEVLY